MSEPRFYVYEHWRLDTNVCFYVGKGNRRRAWNLNCKGNNRNRWHKFLIRKLLPDNLIDVRLVFTGLEEKNAYQLEIERIAYWKGLGVKLVNLTEGGAGSPGVKISKKTRIKKNISSIGRTHTHESRAKLSIALRGNKNAFGVKRSQEYIEKLRIRGKAYIPSAETREKMRQAKLGKKLSEAHKNKIKQSIAIAYQSEEIRKKCVASPEGIERSRLANIGKKQTAEHIAKKVNAILGRKNTEETKQLMKEKALQRWAKKKANQLSYRM